MRRVVSDLTLDKLILQEAALTEDIIALVRQYGRYGYRRVTALLRDAGWHVNRKRVERIWRRWQSCSSTGARRRIYGQIAAPNLSPMPCKNGWQRSV